MVIGLSVPEKKIFKRFFHICVLSPSVSCDIHHLYTHFHSPSHGGSTGNLASISLAMPDNVVRSNQNYADEILMGDSVMS